MMQAEALRPSVIMNFVRQKGQGYSFSKIKSLNAAMRGFLRYLYQKGIMERDLSCVIIGPRSYREQLTPSYLTDAQLRDVLKSMNTESPIGFRNYTIIILLIQYGLRVSELAKLTLDDINWKEETLLIKDRKGQPHLMLPLIEDVTDILHKYLSSYRPASVHPELFLSLKAPVKPLKKKYLSKLARRIFHDVGIKGYAHLIRHTFAKRLIEQGEPLPVIQKLLGHKDISSTRIYARLNIEQLREVAENDSMEMVNKHEEISE
jgi:site-specific recombinase XerD